MNKTITTIGIIAITTILYSSAALYLGIMASSDIHMYEIDPNIKNMKGTYYGMDYVGEITCNGSEMDIFMYGTGSIDSERYVILIKGNETNVTMSIVTIMGTDAFKTVTEIPTEYLNITLE